MNVYSVEEMRQAEAYTDQKGLSYERMMENAGSCVAEYIIKHYAAPSLTVAVLCGAGNNGGDGFVIARRLHDAGYRVTALLLCGAPTTVTAAGMFQRLRERGISVVDAKSQTDFARHLVKESALVIDAVFGTGFHGVLPSMVAQLFSYVSQLQKPVVAVDVPSGVCGDTGAVASATMMCQHTLSFHGYKYAHLLYPARAYCGNVVAVDIGIKDTFENLPFVVDRSFVTPLLRRPVDNTHKGVFGNASLFVGSKGMMGAALLAVRACLRCGVGLAYPVVPNELYPSLALGAPEGVYRPYEPIASPGSVAELCKNARVCLLGPGIGKTPFSTAVCREVVQSFEGTVVLDADGINCLCSHIPVLEERTGALIVTPHPAEMARLLSTTVEQVQSNRFACAKAFARQTGAVVVLKGAGAVIASPDGRCGVSLTGNSGLSKGGSGDVLAGMITAFAAEGIPPFEAACMGAWLHGTAADRLAAQLSYRGMLPSDLIEALPALFLTLQQ